jgi:putative colanic acid biosynthesis UDP-glucose lipid carrier transferase
MDVFCQPCGSLGPFQRVVKRAFDIIAATAGLIIFSPLLVLVSLAIKLDSRGSVFYLQRRYAYNNQMVRVIKFRSSASIQPAETRSHLTRLGHLLSRTGIDGLPMLINVLLGEMSIVGPCFYAILPGTILEEPTSQIGRRNRVKPGLTGWAQVHGSRGNLNTPEVLRHQIQLDLFYIANWSLLLDAKILLIVLFSRRTYVLR